jgi:uncharacterized membrane protein
MTTAGHLWAIGFDAIERAEQVRAQVAQLAAQGCLILVDTAVAVRYPDGCTTLNGEPLVATPNFGGHTLAGFLAGLILGAPPLTSAAASAFTREAIGHDFVERVVALLRPGTSAMFVLDREGDMPAILEGIRGLGGPCLRPMWTWSAPG